MFTDETNILPAEQMVRTRDWVNERNPVPGDYIDQLQKLYSELEDAMASNTQYGWVRPA